MNINFNDQTFKQSKSYQDFIKENQGQGYLNIRAYAANSAIPMPKIAVTVSKMIDNMRVIFFQGETDSSGLISQIALPAPLILENNTVIPLSQDYDIEAKYNDNSLLFKIKIYSNIQVLQNINIVPELRADGSVYGS